MKAVLSLFFGLFAFVLVASGPVRANNDLSSDIAILEGLDAVEAIEIANQWKWTKNYIKSSVNTQAVVFKFPNGVIKEIPLPANKMYVAIAPFIRQTHR